MPRLTPETAERTKSAVSPAMSPTRNPLPTGPAPETTWKPRLICRTPMPSDTAVPKSVTMIAKMSMVAPRGLRRPGPKTGSKIAEINGGRPRLYELYAMAPPTRAYMAQATGPQWSMVCASAVCMASALPGASSKPCGGSRKYVSGSYGP